MRRSYPPINPGDKFGKLTVIREGRRGFINGDGVRYNRRFLCRCECGHEEFVSISYLHAGMKKSCSEGMCRATGSGLFTGLYRYRKPGARACMCRTAESYRSMIERCANPNNPDYGGANPPVTVCEQWRQPGGVGFKQFLKDMGARPEGKTLDRKNPFGNYEPANCRWAAPKTQANNQRRHYPDGWKDDFGAPVADPLNPEAGAF